MDLEEFTSIFENEMQKMVDVFPASMYVKEADGILSACNQFMLDLFGLASREEIIGKNSYDLYSPETAEEMRALDKKVLESDGPIQTEEVTIRADTGEKYIQNLLNRH